jgi:hypothetical protein
MARATTTRPFRACESILFNYSLQNGVSGHYTVGDGLFGLSVVVDVSR